MTSDEKEEDKVRGRQKTEKSSEHQGVVINGKSTRQVV